MRTPVVEVSACELLVDLPVVALSKGAGAPRNHIYFANFTIFTVSNKFADRSKIGAPVLGQEGHQTDAELFFGLFRLLDNESSIF